MAKLISTLGYIIAAIAFAMVLKLITKNFSDMSMIPALILGECVAIYILEEK